ncbi:MAG TPA: hypothetical protein VF832_09210 [Longimicrobiales bacterium]
MKLRAAVVLLALVLAPAAVRAQGATVPLPLTKATVQTLVPLLQADKAGAKDTLIARLARAHMTRVTYSAYKNTLLVAKKDMADQSRLGRNKYALDIRTVNIKILKEATESGIDWSGMTGEQWDMGIPCTGLCALR